MVPKIWTPKLILEQTPGQKSKKHSELQKKTNAWEWLEN